MHEHCTASGILWWNVLYAVQNGCQLSDQNVLHACCIRQKFCFSRSWATVVYTITGPTVWLHWSICENAVLLQNLHPTEMGRVFARLANTQVSCRFFCLSYIITTGRIGHESTTHWEIVWNIISSCNKLLISILKSEQTLWWLTLNLG